MSHELVNRHTSVPIDNSLPLGFGPFWPWTELLLLEIGLLFLVDAPCQDQELLETNRKALIKR